MSKEFQWTDELVKEYAARLIVGNSDGVTYADEHLLHFKQSKTPKKEELYKRYKLLKDWPDGRVGDVYQWNGQGYSNQNRNANVISKSYVEIYATWFEEIIPTQPKPEQPKRVMVTGMWDLSKVYQKQSMGYEYGTSAPVPREKLPAIIAAIERVLNDEEDDLDIFTKAFQKEQLEKMTQHYNSVEKIVTEAEEKAFNAGREEYCVTAMGHRPKYWEFQDYLKSKQA